MSKSPVATQKDVRQETASSAAAVEFAGTGNELVDQPAPLQVAAATRVPFVPTATHEDGPEQLTEDTVAMPLMVVVVHVPPVLLCEKGLPDCLSPTAMHKFDTQDTDDRLPLTVLAALRVHVVPLPVSISPRRVALRSSY